MNKMYLRSRYSYQQYERSQITTNIRKDLRKKLKEFSISISQPETKIWDILLEELFKDEASQNHIAEKVRNYY